MGNPNVDQGVLNRVRGSVQCSNRSDLNVIAPYLGAQGISMSPTGATTEYIGTLTGTARSPNPYMMMEGSIHLLRTQPLSNLYKTAMETDSFLGDLTVRPDSQALGVYYYQNCSITGVAPLIFNGSDAGFVISVRGQYNTNSSLFNL